MCTRIGDVEATVVDYNTRIEDNNTRNNTRMHNGEATLVSVVATVADNTTRMDTVEVTVAENTTRMDNVLWQRTPREWTLLSVNLIPGTVSSPLTLPPLCSYYFLRQSRVVTYFRGFNLGRRVGVARGCWKNPGVNYICLSRLRTNVLCHNLQG